VAVAVWSIDSFEFWCCVAVAVWSIDSYELWCCVAVAVWSIDIFQLLFSVVISIWIKQDFWLWIGAPIAAWNIYNFGYRFYGTRCRIFNLHKNTIPDAVQYMFSSKYFNYTRNIKHSKILPVSAKQAKCTHTYKNSKGNLTVKYALPDIVYYVG